VAATRHERCNLSNFSASAQLIGGGIIFSISMGHVCITLLQYLYKNMKENHFGNKRGKQILTIECSI
jgi:hypothetical protein